MESLEKVWNLSFQFPDLEKVWKFVKSFGNIKKGLELFAFYLRKILKTESVPPARALGSCCRAFDRKQFEGCTVFSHFFLFIVQTALGRPRAASPPLQTKKRHARNSSFVKKRSFASQALGPDFRLTVFVNEEFSPEPVVCSLLLTLPASRSHFRENVIAFCRLEFSLSL